MKAAELILASTLVASSAIVSAHADSLNEIANFAQKICDQTLSGHETSTTLSAHLNGDISGLAKALGLSVSAGGLVRSDGSHYECIPKDKLPSSIPTPAQCKLELAKTLIEERQKLGGPTPSSLISEYDFRLNEIEARDEEIRRTSKDDEKGAMQVYIWRAVRGNVDFQPSLPEFANTHLAGVIVRSKEAGFVDHAKAAIQAARDLENGGPDAHTHQSPGGYGVFSQEYLDSRIKELRAYSEAIHKKSGS
jgi:hypothetical protein